MNNDKPIRPKGKSKPSTTLMFGTPPIKDISDGLSDKPATPAWGVADPAASEVRPSTEKHQGLPPPKVPADNKPIPKRTQLGMPAISATTDPRPKPVLKTSGGQEARKDRFTFSDQDFDSMMVTSAASPKTGAAPDPVPTPESPPSLPPEELKEDEDEAQRTTLPTAAMPDAPQELEIDVEPTTQSEDEPAKEELTFSTVPEPLQESEKRRFKPLLIAVIAGLSIGTLLLAVAYFFVIANNESTSDPSPPKVTHTAVLLAAPRPPQEEPAKADEPEKVVQVASIAPPETPAATAGPTPSPVEPEDAPPIAKAVKAPVDETPKTIAKAVKEPADETPKTKVAAPETKTAVAPKVALKVEKPAVAKASVRPPTVTEGDTVQITLTGVPRRAEVRVNGEPMAPSFSVPRSDKAIKVEVLLNGYDTVVRRVVPGQDKSIYIKMKK